ncbi:hypothetical protein CKO25_18890 [Thiocapsa imhoffii]|uniref:Four helix bundle protein n=1 Tax=Thiocapsa imhoffii TaxID=382777 RepID=A0A9X1BA74_9GAMM|nr:four helix bundle protein [Thiocapsa imhoffii]MBK1646667.1 hypothetical protein [Thiocapsa imhoffii]
MAEAFEDLEVWKRGARLSADIDRGLRDLKDWGFRDQITRSGLSIPSNIAEGYERESNRECINFLSYAKCASIMGRGIECISCNVSLKS